MFRYSEYALGYSPKVIAKLKPTCRGWLGKHALSAAPLVVLVVSDWLVAPLLTAHLSQVAHLAGGAGGWLAEIAAELAAEILGQPSVETVASLLEVLIFLVTPLLLVLVVSWVLRCREGVASVGLTLLFAAAQVALSFDLERGLPEAILSAGRVLRPALWTGSAAASLLTLVLTEAFRKSITYTLTDTAIVIAGGLWKRQRRTIPYSDIGSVVVEQSLLGRLLGYGTVIPVAKAAWGQEFYTRAVGVGAESRGVGVGVGYARTVQEVSRDPLKVLYAVPNPEKVAETLEKMATAPYRAEIDQLRELREIRKLLSKPES